MAPKTVWHGLAMLALALGCSKDSTGAPVISTLQNDNFTSGDTPNFQLGFQTGEAAAVRLGPQNAAYTVRRVIFFFGGDTATKTVTVTIYQDGDTLNPGTLLFSNDYSKKGASAALQEIDLTAQDIHVAAHQRIRVAVTFHHDGVPSVATDGAITATRNLANVGPGQWALGETLGFNGDFIIRAEISTP